MSKRCVYQSDTTTPLQGYADVISPLGEEQAKVVLGPSKLERFQLKITDRVTLTDLLAANRELSDLTI